MTKMTIYVKIFISISQTSPRGEMWHSSKNTWTCSYPYKHRSNFLKVMGHNHLYMFQKFLLETHCHVLKLCESPQHHFKMSNVPNVLPLCIPLFWWRIYITFQIWVAPTTMCSITSHTTFMDKITLTFEGPF